MSKAWYELLFENYARQYDREVFTQGTQGECDFFEKELGYDRTLNILDVGCGTGRHCLEMARRGYNITGVDLSAAQLARAREKAREADLAISFIQGDAGNLPFSEAFDVALMICEGGFSLMETDEMNYEILRSVTSALRGGGQFIFTTLNGLYPLFHSLDQFYKQSGQNEGATYHSEGFDLLTLRDRNLTVFVDDDGQERTIETTERYYLPSEISWQLKSLGFEEIAFYGAKLGAFSREDPLTTSDFEMLVVARKKTE